MNDCIFCRIARGEAPASIVYQDDDVTAFRDLHPQAPVHILIVPNRHIVGVAQVGPEDAALLGKLFVVASRLAEQENIVNGYRLVVNNGPQAGQSVFHLHVHLLGGRPLSWPPG
ncbi:MAG: histidine triad nucleotide-binding protein [Chloroflexi bacterium]|nr:MAG: histidine triad nucleotide-binding protein [Chloroflexota bacterium]